MNEMNEEQYINELERMQGIHYDMVDDARSIRMEYEFMKREADELEDKIDDKFKEFKEKYPDSEYELDM